MEDTLLPSDFESQFDEPLLKFSNDETTDNTIPNLQVSDTTAVENRILANDLSRNVEHVPPNDRGRNVSSTPAVSPNVTETPSNEELLTQKLLQERADTDLGFRNQRVYDRGSDLTMSRIKHNKAKRSTKVNSLVPP